MYDNHFHLIVEMCTSMTSPLCCSNDLISKWKQVFFDVMHLMSNSSISEMDQLVITRGLRRAMCIFNAHINGDPFKVPKICEHYSEL